MIHVDELDLEAVEPIFSICLSSNLSIFACFYSALPAARTCYTTLEMQSRASSLSLMLLVDSAS